MKSWNGRLQQVRSWLQSDLCLRNRFSATLWARLRLITHWLREHTHALFLIFIHCLFVQKDRTVRSTKCSSNHQIMCAKVCKFVHVMFFPVEKWICTVVKNCSWMTYEVRKTLDQCGHAKVTHYGSARSIFTRSQTNFFTATEDLCKKRISNVCMNRTYSQPCSLLLM